MPTPIGDYEYKAWMLYELIVPLDRIITIYKLGDDCYLEANISLCVSYDEILISESDYDEIQTALNYYG